jgi:hypothetical protein
MLFGDKRSRQELRRMNVSAEMAGTFVGLIFGGISLFACLSALWMGDRPEQGAVHFFANVSIVFFAIAWISIFFRILQLDSTEKRLRLLAGLILGFGLLVADVLVMVFFEMKLKGALGSAVFIIHVVVGIGGIGLFMMARAFAK